MAVTIEVDDIVPPLGMPMTQGSVSERVAHDNTIIITALNYGFNDNDDELKFPLVWNM